MSDQDPLINGKPLSSLRVVDLKEELEKRGLSKSGAKKDLSDRLKKELLIENLRNNQQQANIVQTEVPNIAFQTQNPFVQQYLASQQAQLMHQVEVMRKVQESSASEDGSVHDLSLRSPTSSRGRRSASPQKPAVMSPPHAAPSAVPETISTSIQQPQEVPIEQPIAATIPPPNIVKVLEPVPSEPPVETPPQIKVVPPTPEPTPVTPTKAVEDEPATSVSKSPIREKTPQKETSPLKRQPTPEVPKEASPVKVSSPAKEATKEPTPTKSPAKSSSPVKSPPPTKAKEPSPIKEVIKTASPQKETVKTASPAKEAAKVLSPSKEKTAPVVADKEPVKETKPAEPVKQSEPVKPLEKKRRWGAARSNSNGGGDGNEGAESGGRSSLRRRLEISSDSLKQLIPDLDENNSSQNNASVSTKSNGAELDNSVKVSIGKDETNVTPSLTVETTAAAAGVSSVGSEQTNKDSDASKVQVTEEAKVVVAPPREKSPARRPPTNVIIVNHLTRPFTQNQLRDFLSQHGAYKADGGFWIDRIKSKCVVAYENVEVAKTTRDALHGVEWPRGNPTKLAVDFSTEEELANYIAHGTPEPPAAPKPVEENKDRERERDERRAARESRHKEDQKENASDAVKSDRRRGSPPTTTTNNDKDHHKDRSSPTRAEKRHRHDSDRDRKKDVDAGEPSASGATSAVPEEPPKSLDDLFRKTEATPAIYWLPLNEEAALKKAQAREAQERVEREERARRMNERNARQRSPPPQSQFLYARNAPPPPPAPFRPRGGLGPNSGFGPPPNKRRRSPPRDWRRSPPRRGRSPPRAPQRFDRGRRSRSRS